MSDDGVQPICLWSGPRNVSTALMYSFRELADVRVVDEPLYGHYLRVSGAPHPGRDEVIAAMNCDGGAVMRQLLDEQRDKPVPRLFIKHMAHHLVELDLEFLHRTTNVLLIRDPRDMLPSLTVQLPGANLDDTGLKRQWELFAALEDAGRPPVVLDSRELLTDPGTVLEALCAAIDVPYSRAMLEWRPGARPEDGVWAPHWYHAVHRSSGFQAYEAKREFPRRLLGLLALCKPWYERLYAHALRAPNGGDRL